MSTNAKKGRVYRAPNEPIKPDNLVITEINVRSVDRTPKDVQSLVNAVQSAESKTVPNRTRYYDLLAHVMLDGHLSGIIYNKRIATVLNKKLVYKSADGKKVDEMDKVIRSKAFRKIRKRIQESRAYGLSGMEFVPGTSLKFEDVPRKHIKIEYGVISKEQSDTAGYVIDELPLVWVIGEKDDLGYLLECSFYALIKKGGFADWAQYVEIFGQPVRVIYYDAYDSKTKIELRKVLDDAGGSLALMIPNQAKFELMDGKQSNGTGELQERLKDACNQEMSVRVLGVTETATSSKRSGYAQSESHARQQAEVVKDDLEFELENLNSEKFISILQSYGLPVVEGGCFEHEKEVDLAMLKSKVEIDKSVSEKVPVSDDYWYETYNIPKPDNYDELKAKMEADRALRNGADPNDEDPQPGKPKPGKPEKKPRNLSWLRDLAVFFD